MFTDLTGTFIVLKTLLQIGFAFSVGECLRCFDLLAKGCVGFSLQVMAAVKKVLKLSSNGNTPEPILPSGLVAGLKADAPVGGHAKAVKTMSPEVLKMRFPGFGRAI